MPHLVVEVQVVPVILGFSVNFLGYTGSNFCEIYT
jgi:hypothetical protein